MLPALATVGSWLAKPAFWSGVGQAGTALGGLGSILGAFGGGKKKKLRTFSTLSPGQQQWMSQLGSFLSGRVGQGLPAWEGEFAAPMSAAEEQGQRLLADYISGGVGPTATMGLGAYQQALKGMSPAEVSRFYQQYISPSETRYLRETLIPTFKESMVPGGTLRSTGTERGIGDIISRFGEGQLGRMGEMMMGERARSMQALGMLPTMAGIEGGLPQIEAAAQYGALPRLIEQQELMGKIQEFIRTTPELSPVLDRLMQMLNIQTMGAYFG